MAEDLQLSCGTSLSEQAHGTLLPPSSSSSSVPQEEKTEPSSSAFKNNKSIQTIDDLRAHIAQDALTQNSSKCNNNNHSSKAPLTTFTSPFELPGQQPITLPMVYCDQTASNRPLQSIEKYLQDKCWPLYGNTHTNTSITGSQSTAFVAEARQLVAEAVNAKTTGKASLDLVLFA
jgi:hypothetical protein